MFACLMNSVKRVCLRCAHTGVSVCVCVHACVCVCVCLFVGGGGCGRIVGEVCHFLAHEGLSASCAGLVLLPGGRCLQCCLHDPSSVPAPAPTVCFTPWGGLGRWGGGGNTHTHTHTQTHTPLKCLCMHNHTRVHTTGSANTHTVPSLTHTHIHMHTHTHTPPRLWSIN